MPRYVARVPVRWSDVDAFGHVNNARVLTLLEEARTLLVATASGSADSLMHGVVVARHEIDYLRPVDWRPAPIRIDTWVGAVRHASFDVGYELFDHDGRVAARASSRLAPLDLGAGRPRRLSADERTHLAAWLDPA